jgi:hypothetical protein
MPLRGETAGEEDKGERKREKDMKKRKGNCYVS